MLTVWPQRGRAAVLDRGVVELDAFERSGVTLARIGSKDRR